ncbi:hypothetical protein V8E54_010382 [Elaphomyces granulatus]
MARFLCPYAVHNPSKYNASNKYKPCMDPGFPTISRLKTHIKRRHYDEEHIQHDVRYQLEQQRRKQKDEDKWKSIYKILFPGERAPSPFFINPSLALEVDSNDVSPPSRTHLPTALEVSALSNNSTPAKPDRQPGNIAGNIAADPMQCVQGTSSTSNVPPIVTNGFSHDDPGFFDNGISYAELDEATRDILNSWSLLWQ